MNSIKSKFINNMALYLPNYFLEIRHLYRTRLAKEKWLEDDPFFLHIPKSGGTSVAAALSRPEPGHASWKYIAKKFPQVERKSCYYLIARKPEERMLSTFSYMKGLHRRFGTSSLPIVTKYSNVDDFIVDYISRIDVDQHYFLRTIFKTIEGAPLERVWALNFYGLQANFLSFSKEFMGEEVRLPHKNSSAKFQEPAKLSERARQIIEEKYEWDQKLYAKLSGKEYALIG